MYNSVKTSSNPNDILLGMAQANPNIMKIINLINQHGGNGQEAFMQEAKSMGMTDSQAQSYLNSIRSLFG